MNQQGQEGVEREATSGDAASRPADPIDGALISHIGEFVSVPVMLPRATYPFGWSRTNLRRFLGLLLTALIALGFLWQVQAILPPFLIAFFLAALLDPSVRYMERRGRSRVYAILMFYLLALMILAAGIVFVVPLARQQIVDISTNLDTYVRNIQDSANSFIGQHSKLLSYVGFKDTNFAKLINDKSGPVQTAINTFLKGATDSATGALSKALWFVIIPVSGFFIMRDYPRLRARLIWLCPDRHQERIDLLSREIVDVFSAYLRGLAKICALYSLCAFILFEALNVHYAIFLGLLAGLFYAVPYVGNLITATTAAAIAFLMQPHAALIFWHVPTHCAPYAIMVAVCCVVLANIVFDQIVYPRVVGGSVGLHPVVSLFALSSGATMFGVWGMLLATPVAASIQIILMYCFPRLAQPPPSYLMESNHPPGRASTSRSGLRRLQKGLIERFACFAEGSLCACRRDLPQDSARPQRASLSNRNRFFRDRSARRTARKQGTA